MPSPGTYIAGCMAVDDRTRTQRGASAFSFPSPFSPSKNGSVEMVRLPASSTLRLRGDDICCRQRVGSGHSSAAAARTRDKLRTTAARRRPGRGGGNGGGGGDADARSGRLMPLLLLLLLPYSDSWCPCAAASQVCLFSSWCGRGDRDRGGDRCLTDTLAHKGSQSILHGCMCVRYRGWLLCCLSLNWKP